MTEWWTGLPDAETQVGCGGEMHTLRWHAGDLHAVDHEDVEGERALAALGGERCTCVDVLVAWARHADDLRVLTLSSRGAGDQLAVQVDWSGSKRGGRRGGFAISGRSSGWTAYGPGGPGISGWEDAEDELVPLLGLGGGLADRLVASVAAAWARTDRPDEEVTAARARLTAALYGRVVPAMRAWLGEPNLDVDFEMTDQDGQWSVRRLDDGRIRAELPFAWLSEVWCRGVGSIGGRLCMSVTIEDGGEGWRLATLAPDLRTAQLFRLNVPPATDTAA